MKLVIANLLVAFAFFQDGLAGSIQLYAGEMGTVNCTGISGSTCGSSPADCDSVYFCIPNIKDPLKAKCDPGQTCNAGSCSSVKSPQCEYGSRTFKCNTLGMYPEPSSCKKFNFCVPNTTTPDPDTLTTIENPIEATCEDGWGYNAVTTFCDKPLRNNNCEANDRPVPPCLTIGQSGTLKDNPTVYYICMPYSPSTNDSELYPSIFKCPGNTKYKGKYVCK